MSVLERMAPSRMQAAYKKLRAQKHESSDDGPTAFLVAACDIVWPDKDACTLDDLLEEIARLKRLDK